MTTSISFPNLGICLKNVGQSITVFDFEIAFYGMIIGLGVLAGILVAGAEAKRTKQDPEIYYDLAIYAVIFSVIGARLYYVIFSWDNYKNDLLSILNIRQGGLAIYGAVIAAVITVFVYARIKKLSFVKMVDTAVMGLVLGQIMGRWGNFFNREAFGGFTNNLFAMQIPVDYFKKVGRFGEIQGTGLLGQTVEAVVNGISTTCIQVHPTFLYESLWNLGILLILFLYRKNKKFDGELFAMYLTGYGIGRFWIEGLRVDQLQIGNTGLAVSQILAAVIAVTAVSVIIYKRYRLKSKNN